MRVTKLSGKRFNLALDRFQEGEPLTLQEASFVLLNEDTIQCNYQSSWSPENLDREKAKKDFSEAEKTFSFLKENSSNFRDLVKNKNLVISLIDDYGMGAVELANFKNGEISWKEIKE